VLDLKITGGTIVDGSGAARYQGDVGVRDGRIVAVGNVAEDARETIDATGKIVAPGFIDVHTHYDAQVFWDPALSPSCFHGVTTILGGFCGFSIAPMSPEAADYLMKMLARVEGMPLETLQMAVPWSWRSFGEFLASFEGRVGLNAGFFAGHSAIRRVVMGERAVGETCTPEELEQMKALLDQSLEQGALGFSSTISASHNDGDGNPVPSRWADYSEIVELARVVSRHEGTGLEFLPDVDFGPGVPELITDLSLAGNRPVNWNALIVMGTNPEARARAQLAVSDFARERGGEVIALTVPCTPAAFVNFKTGFALDVNPGMWREMFKWPVEERIERLRNDPALRQQLKDDVAGVSDEGMMSFVSRIHEYQVASVTAEQNKKYEGRLIGDIAAEEGRDPLDVMLDIALDDDLTAVFIPNFGSNDHESYVLRGKIWQDDRTLIGASDAGAHMDMIDTFSFSTTVLQQGVRNHGVISLEDAVYQMTDRPARYMGLIDRGLLAPGYHADIVVFDEASVGCGPTYPRYDVPGNQFRLYAEAEGISHVIVNGVEIVRNGEHTGKLPGKVLRSGTDTRTVALDAMRETTSERADSELMPQK
jgi:N-acyl-D-aspartate/D-glutamate deacylase